MMSAASITAAYAAACRQNITVRRYSVSGQSRTYVDYTARGHARYYNATELTDSVVQGDQEVIVLASDLDQQGFALPITTADRIVIGDKELAVRIPGTRNAPDGTLIACALQVRG